MRRATGPHRSSRLIDPRDRLLMVISRAVAFVLASALIGTVLLALVGQPVPSILVYVQTTALGYFGGILVANLGGAARSEA